MSTGVTAPTVSLGNVAEPRTRAKRVWWKRGIFANPIGLTGLVIVTITILVAIFAPLIAPYPPDDQSAKRLLSPSWDHIFGTDELGRDTFSRIVYGSRVSLEVGIIAVFVALAVGGMLGLIAGFFGGTF